MGQGSQLQFSKNKDKAGYRLVVNFEGEIFVDVDLVVGTVITIGGSG